MNPTYSRRVDNFDDVSDTDDEPTPPIENVPPPSQRPLPTPGQIPLSVRHRPLTNGAQNAQKQEMKAPEVHQPMSLPLQESELPLHPMEEFNIAEAKKKEEREKAKAAKEEAKRQAERERAEEEFKRQADRERAQEEFKRQAEKNRAKESAKQVPKPEVEQPAQIVLGSPPPEEAPDLVPMEEKKEEPKIEDLPWPDCIPKVESFAHFRQEKLKVCLEKQEKENAERAAQGLPPREYVEPTWSSDWSVMPPIEWAVNEKGEKYVRVKPIIRPKPETPPVKRVYVSNQYLDPYDPPRIVKTGPPKPEPSVESIPLGHSFNSKSQQYQGQRPLTRPSTSDNQSGEKLTYQGQGPLKHPSTSSQKPQEHVVQAPEVQKKVEKSFGRQKTSEEPKKKKTLGSGGPPVEKRPYGDEEEEAKPLKSFGFNESKDEENQKSSGFNESKDQEDQKSFGSQKPVEQPKEPEPEQKEQEAPKEVAPTPLPKIQIPRVPQPAEIRESSQCYNCKTEVPYSQLFICLLASCPYRIKEGSPLQNPVHFFQIEKAFCGLCSFVGCHKPHAKHMTEALPVAISTASAEIGDHLQREFDELAKLKHEDQVDYVIMGQLNADKLREIPVVDYLSSSPNVTEWYARIKQLEDVISIFKNARREAHVHIADVAERALKYYNMMHQVVLHDLHDRKPKEAQLKAIQLADHARNLGLPEDYYTKKQEHNRSSNSASTRSGQPATNPQVMYYVEDQARLLESLDAEIRGNGQNAEQMEKIDKNLHASAVKMLYYNMVRRFDLIKESMTPEKAIQDVSDLLASKMLEADVKEEAAKMYNEHMEIKLIWPPVNKEEDQQEDLDAQSNQSTIKEKITAQKKDSEE